MNFRFRAAILITTALILTSTATVVRAQTATLAWDASADSTVTGYRVSYGTRTGTYSQTLDVGKVTQYTVTGLDLSLDYFFAVQAYNGAGLVSAFSNEAMLPAPVPPGTTTISSLTANIGYPLLVSNAVTWTASGASTRGPVEYKFLIYSPQSGWTVIQDYSQNASATWLPGWNDLGSHTVQVWARTVGSPAVYEAWVSTNAFDVVTSPVQITADVDFPTPPANPVHWTATIAGSSSLQLEYKFLLLNTGTGVWTVLRDYATSNQATWTPVATGNFLMQVWARRVGSTASYEVWGGTPTLSVARTALQVTALTANTAFPAMTGATITWTARVKGGNTGPLQYQFVRYSAASGWSIVKPFSGSNTYTWTPVWGEEGQYSLQVWVKNSGSTAAYDAWLGTNMFDIQRAPLRLTLSNGFPVPAGTAVTITAQVPDPSATFEYAFYRYDRGTGTWSLARAYSTTSSLTWTPTANGTFLFQVWARKVGSAAQYDVWAATDYLTVASGPAQVTALNSDTSLPAKAGTTITWTAAAQGGTATPLQYKFVMYTEGVGWSMLRDWSTQNTVTWTPTNTDLGNHVVQVWVRSAGSTAAYEGWLGSGYFMILP
jgi:hypothetical protein